MTTGHSYTTGPLLGQGWKHVEEWPQAGPSRLRGAAESNAEADAAVPGEEGDEEEEYEEEEEEIYVTIDLGPNADPLTLGISTEYQLIGLDTPTPFLKIGNDVFQGTPRRLIGSEIITKDTRDPQNPIKHSHPAIGHTDYRIALEPVKLIPRSTAPAHEKLAERPPLFARDAPEAPAQPEIPTLATLKSKRRAPVATSTHEEFAGAETPPIASTPGSVNPPVAPATATSRKKSHANRSNPLSSHYNIPTLGEISADGIPRIDGQEVRNMRKQRKSKKTIEAEAALVAEAEAEADPHQESMMATAGSAEYEMSEGVQAATAMDVDAQEGGDQVASSSAAPVSSSSAPGNNNNNTNSVRQGQGPDIKRILMPDAPRGYTKAGLPRRAPGRRKGQKTAAELLAASRKIVTEVVESGVPVTAAGEPAGENTNESARMEVDANDGGDAAAADASGMVKDIEGLPQSPGDQV